MTEEQKGKVLASKYARENNYLIFGLCLGMQIAVIDFARNVLGLQKANSEEFDPQTPDPVIHIMDDQKTIEDKGATMRLGACRFSEERKLCLQCLRKRKDI